MNKAATSLEKSASANSKILLLTIGIILIGANLRAPLTSVGSLIPFIRDDLAMSNALAGTITTLPLLAFALFSPFAPKIANKSGMERTIFFSLIVLIIGIIIRSLQGIIPLFTGTILIGLAIAVGNVLLPGFIKMNFPLKIGVMTGIYAVFMNLFGALASGISVPLSSFRSLGWHGALEAWAILAFIAVLFWLPQLRNNYIVIKPASTPSQRGNSIWRSPLAWKVTLFMGLQSFMFYTMMTWLPGILQLNGYSSNAAGWMLFLMQFAIIPITFIIPVLAGRMKDQKILSIITALFFFFGIGGLLIGNASLIPLSIILFGIASGSAFSLAMMFFSLRTNNGGQAAALSGMAQSFGYLLAAIGPVLFGGLHDLTNGWTVPLSMLLIISIVILFVGIEAGKDRIVTHKN
ncbi:CynX/NimT family MFS transporter [Metabacillus fastidiosus]|uniref:MFS transporter n=1 Tax=Metabacillus fastidiosus TaxID=1458 RepID=A0ABU6NTT5_9BACI|nr:MFS transporter [Metabacillus fastidiosus]